MGIPRYLTLLAAGACAISALLPSSIQAAPNPAKPSRPAKPAADAARIPSPSDLMSRILAAHRRMGPSRFTMRISYSYEGELVLYVHQVQWNDTTHWRGTVSTPRGPRDVYSDGERQVTFLPAQNAYAEYILNEETNPAGMLLMLEAFERRAVERGGADWAKSQAAADFRVAPAIYKGEPVYSITSKQHSGFVLIAGRKDFLLRKTSVPTGPPYGDIRYETTYQQVREPFAPETFRFVPPPGATVIPSPAPRVPA